MTPELIGIVSIAVLVILAFVGVPVFISMLAVSVVGTWIVAGSSVALGLLTTTPYVKTTSYVFSALPMFILMGSFASGAGIAQEAYRVAVLWLGGLRGGLAMATTVGCAFFSACSGSSISTTAIFTRVSLPEMLSRGYRPSLASASIATAGTLAVMIPPSGLMVIYSFITEVSLGKLLLAGVIPGVILTILFCIAIYLQVLINPSIAPKLPGRATLREKISSMKLLTGVAIVAASLIGGIYTGIFTPTEAGAAGALVTLVIGLARRRLTNRSAMVSALVDTAYTTGLIFALLIASMIFGRFFAFVGLTDQVIDFLTSLPVSPTWIIVLLMVMYFILGMFMDEIPMLTLTLPIVYPAIEALGIDGVWFGVLMVLATQLGMIAPPVGIMVFTVKAIAGESVTLGEIYRGVTPFLIATWAMVILLLIYPEITLFLPNNVF
jgi:tripartite ATP-independent transporter DctM subunit